MLLAVTVNGALRTVCVSTDDVLPLYFVSPGYTAVIACVPCLAATNEEVV